MVLDKNADENGEYIVKSYYFDTLLYNAYTEKLNGVYEREKHRLRTYGDSGYHRLEKKVKRGYLNKKISGEIDALHADMLIRGYTDIKTGDDDTDAIISEMYLNGCRSSIYIEYSRQAFISNELDIRITFDKGINALFGNYGLSNDRPGLIPVRHNDQVILEIKYKHFLPGWIEKAALHMLPSEFSLSKYALSLGSILR